MTSTKIAPHTLYKVRNIFYLQEKIGCFDENSYFCNSTNTEWFCQESQAYNVDRNPFIVERRGYRDPDDPRWFSLLLNVLNKIRRGPESGGGNEINPHIKSPNRKPIHCVKEEIQGPKTSLKGCRKLFARVEWMRSACEFQVGWEKDVSRQTTSLTRPKSQPCAKKSKWNFEQFEPDFGEKNLPLKKFHN